MARPREFDSKKVIDDVMNTFWRNGYEKTSAQDLVEATGLGRGSLYNAFSDKQSLYEQALIQYRERTLQNVEVLKRPGSTRANLRSLLMTIVDSDMNDPMKRGCLATNAAIESSRHSAAVAKLVRENFQILERGINEAIQRGQKLSDIRRDKDAEVLASLFLNTIQGFRVMARVTPTKQRDRFAQIVDLTLNLLD